MYVILVYDIVLDNKVGNRVLNKVFKTCKKYLHHIQNSVFEGELTKAQYEKLRVEIKKLIRQEKDSVIIFRSRTDKWLDKDVWGVEDDKTSNIL